MSCFKFITLVFLAFQLVSCASYFKRKECEKVNWFQHGEDVAMRGQSLENDSFLNECRKAEAKINESGLDQGFKKGRSDYCEPETVFLTGKKGEPLVAIMCDGANLRLLRQKHLEGVTSFCDPSNGENAGATGNRYKNVCPKNMEAPFLVEFKKGRKKYLAAEVQTREQQVIEIESEISRLNNDRANKVYQLAALGAVGKVLTKKTRMGKYKRTEQYNISDDAQTQSRRDELQRDIDRYENEINERRKKQSELRDEVRKLRSELLTL